MGHIPEWNTLYPSLEKANKQQKEFYVEFTNSLDNNLKIDIENNLSYVFVYLYKTINEFKKSKNIENLALKFERILEYYGDIDKINIYINSWLKDAYLYGGDFENAWKYLKLCKFIKGEDIIYIRSNCKDNFINAEELFLLLSSYKFVSDFGKNNIKQVSELLNIFLKDFYFENKMNCSIYFLKNFDFGNLSENDFDLLKTYYIDEKEFYYFKNEYLKTHKNDAKFYIKYDHNLFNGSGGKTMTIERKLIPSIISIALINVFKKIIREAENTVRSEINLPLVSISWENEAQLFYKIYDRFPNEKILHHGQPDWLNRMHFDIYFPNKNIGIDYYGTEYNNPFDYIGGEESYKKKQIQDKKKKKISIDNGCVIIPVFDNYDFEEIVSQINKYL